MRNSRYQSLAQLEKVGIERANLLLKIADLIDANKEHTTWWKRWTTASPFGKP